MYCVYVCVWAIPPRRDGPAGVPCEEFQQNDQKMCCFSSGGGRPVIRGSAVQSLAPRSVFQDSEPEISP